MREVKAALAGLGSRFSVQLFSSLKHIGIEEAKKVLCEWLGMTMAPDGKVGKPAKPEVMGKVARPRKRSSIGWSARSTGKAKPTQKQKSPVSR